MRRSVEPSEWTLILSLSFILASLFIISQINSYRSTPSLIFSAPSQPAPVTITLSGAVQRPGAYTVESGTPLAQVLRKARPKTHANLQNYNLEEPLLTDTTLQIEERPIITVTIDGVEITLPAGSRICDLKGKISLEPDADPQFFRRKKQLRHGEKIEIPKKGVAKK